MESYSLEALEALEALDTVDSIDSDISSVPNANQPELATQISTDIPTKDVLDLALSIMALQQTDALSRTFADLKSKSEDVRLLASYALYGLVATASRGILHSLLP